MAVLALLAAKGAPGVSTWATALTLAWPTATGRQVLLVDADVSGAGPLSAHQRYGLGDGSGLLRWVAGHRGSGPLESELLALDGAGAAAAARSSRRGRRCSARPALARPRPRADRAVRGP